MIGIDEVGRGAWAGPLLVCSARLRAPIKGLADSKVLSPRRRAQLAKEIAQRADVGYGWVAASEIDAIGLSAALKLGALRAVQKLKPDKNEAIIIDGTINLLPSYTNVVTKVKADATVPCVSAASIAAKVARDTYMRKMAPSYAVYGFESHVGYGTAQHTLAIQQFGACQEHRKSFRLPEQL